MRVPTPRADRRPLVLVEAAVLGFGYWLYDWIRTLQAVNQAQAVDNAKDLLHAERDFGLAHEHAVNNAFAHHLLPALVANYWYAIAHLGITATALTWLFVFRPRDYRPARTLLVVMSLIAFVSFWLFPVAPPRLLPGAGFVDTLAQHHTVGDYEHGSLPIAANLYASMPSLHVGWALWVAWVVNRNVRNRLVRWLVLLYPVITAVDVVATGNHYLADVGGAIVLLGLALVVRLGLAWAGKRWILVRRRRARGRGRPSSASPERADVPVA